MLLALACAGSAHAAVNPHLDPSLMPGGCRSCHIGHGSPGSPMLGADQKAVCLRCHDTQAEVDNSIAEGLLGQNAKPGLLNTQLSKTWQHPSGEGAYSRRQEGTIVCTSCHSPHRSSPQYGVDTSSPRERGALGGRKLSPANRGQLEYELCESCHGQYGATTESRRDISRLMNPNSRSFHPVESAAIEPSPSVLPEYSGSEVNCTDCHGDNDPTGLGGMHGSDVRYILKAGYTTLDGSNESPETYALCYVCHDRDLVLDSNRFPLHRSHVVDNGASCSTCHNPHGSVDNRALITFGDDTESGAINPSGSTGRLDFESDSPGSGACYLTCHGVDHGPETYGSAAPTSAFHPEETKALQRTEDRNRISPPRTPPGSRAPKVRNRSE
jgi:predicted CXXCH cytochrome family protein